MNEQKINFTLIIKQGLLAGIIALSLSVIGMVELFSQRELISGVFSLGELLLYLAPLIIGFTYTSNTKPKNVWGALGPGALLGFFTAIPLVILIALANAFELRQYLINVSPALIELLTNHLILVVVMAIVGALISYLPNEKLRHAIIMATLWTLGIAMFSEVLSERLRTFLGAGVARFIFSAKALNLLPAIAIYIITGLSYYFRKPRTENQQSFGVKFNNQSKKRQLIVGGIIVLVLLLLPLIVGTYLSEVINNVGLYILMGLGLNIVVGFAGLLDLGYVAFFAIGAYTMAILTSNSSLGVANMSFWAALPFCVAAAVLAGITLGIPVLRMRGDYLAIVTLGFGEIIRILALSDLLKPFIGGAQGILQIPKPQIGSITLVKPEQLYYVILGGVLIAAYISWTLRDSRLGRQWMAMREDEDVAEAMGINLVSTKLLAFAIGAGFSGLSGAIFASKLTSIFPHSFNLLISINVLVLIIVGGMGSLPGVAVGAAILVGLPELLREFKEYRLLMYGALLILMMLQKPEGLWPSEIQKRELHAHEEEANPDIVETVSSLTR